MPSMGLSFLPHPFSPPSMQPPVRTYPPKTLCWPRSRRSVFYPCCRVTTCCCTWKDGGLVEQPALMVITVPWLEAGRDAHLSWKYGSSRDGWCA